MPSSVSKTASQIATETKSGEVSAVKNIEQYLNSAQIVNPELNIFLGIDEESVMEQAHKVDAKKQAGEQLGALAGVPIAIKDNICVQDWKTTCASKMLEGWASPYDATVIRKLKEADAILIGKTNLDEFAMGSSTENSAFGPTRNPHNPEYVPGGSSGGSAAAVAANLAPLALGSDTGGSIRQPASFCGVVGVKPTYGLVSRYGLVAFASSFDQIGPIAKNVTDAALLLDVIKGHDPADMTSLEPELQDSRSFHSELKKTTDMAGMRIGIITEFMDPEIVSNNVRDLLKEVKDALIKQRCKVEEISIPSVRDGLTAYYIITSAEASSNLARYDGVRYGLRVDAPTAGEMMAKTRAEGFGAEVKRRILLGTFALSSGYYDQYYLKADRLRKVINEELNATYAKFDVLLSPTSPFTAFKLGEKLDDPQAMYACDAHTVIANLIGHPAISVPFKTGENDLPVGVQVMALRLDEIRMLQVAKAIEDIRDAN